MRGRRPLECGMQRPKAAWNVECSGRRPLECGMQRPKAAGMWKAAAEGRWKARPKAESGKHGRRPLESGKLRPKAAGKHGSGRRPLKGLPKGAGKRKGRADAAKTLRLNAAGHGR